MTSRRRPVVAGSVATVLVVLAAGCSSSGGDPAPTLQVVRSDGSRVGGELPDTPLGTSIIVPLGVLCTTGDPVDVDGVTAVGATGSLRVTSWGTRHLDPDQDAESIPMYGVGRVASVQGFGTDHPVSSRCSDPRPANGPIDQFAVGVTAGTSRAAMTGVRLHYRSGRTTFAQFDFVLCSTHACPATLTVR